MSLIVAPYNDSMRLGMGFNSYTQTICCDKAVTFSNKQVKQETNTSQVVSYSSKCVSRLSDIVKSMNVSYSSAIKKGTVEIAGSSTAINEEKIKESDTNVVVSVKVVNQTTIIDETCTFNPIEGVLPNQETFNDTFGDCYISGFIEGGDFNGIVSIKALDRSKAEDVVSKVKKALGNGASKNEFNLDIDTFSQSNDASEVLSQTETTISVSYMGGGQIKDPRVCWDINSVLETAAAFPSFVAKCPQKTWAILTKYKTNRSFKEWDKKSSLSLLEYDLVASYTSDMFDNYMEYKQLVKLTQDILNNPDAYEVQNFKTKAIPIAAPTLVAVKAALRLEMAKIVRAVDVLSKDPEALTREAIDAAAPTDEYVQRIMSGEAWGPSTRSSIPETGAGLAQGQVTQPFASSGAAAGNNGVKASPTPDPPKETSRAVLDLKSMMEAEIWADLMPRPIKSSVPASSVDIVSTIPSSLAAMFPMPPSDPEGAKRQVPAAIPGNNLKIIRAVCGVSDVTDTIQGLVTMENTLTFRGSAVATFTDGCSKLPANTTLYLSFMYQYGDQIPRIVIAKSETSTGGTDSSRTYAITSDSTEYPVVQPTAWNADSWSINAYIYGAKLFTDTTRVEDLTAQLRKNYDGGNGTRWAQVNNTILGDDPWPGQVKTGVVFYQARPKGAMRAAVGIEGGSPITLTDRLLGDVPDPLDKPLSLEYDSSSIKPIANKIYTRDMFIRGLRSEPFLKFPNGVTFYFQPDGNFVVYHGNRAMWASATTREVTDASKWVLTFQPDNKICIYDEHACIFAANAGGIVDNASILGQIVFSDQAPYIEMGWYNDNVWERHWST